MKQLFGQLLVLVSMVIAAIVAVQGAQAFAWDPPEVAPSSTWRCDWTVTCGDKTGLGTASGSGKSMARSNAMTAAMQWCSNNCGTTLPAIALGMPYEVIPVVKETPAEERRVQSRDSGADWVVLFRCKSKQGPTLEIRSSPAATFCAAYTEAREFVCEAMANPFFGGACRCCYQVVERPCCCCCCGSCSR